MKFFVLVLLVFLYTTCESRRVSLIDIEDVLKEANDLIEEIKDQVLAQKKDDSCEDVNPNCEKFKATTDVTKWDRKCKNGEWMITNCPKTCDICDGSGGTGGPSPSSSPSTTSETGAICKDVNPNCETFKAATDATEWDRECKNGEWMITNCPKTCDICDNSGETGGPSPSSGPSTTKETGESGGSSGAIGKPVICNDENKGHCECADPSKGFQTYVFEINGVGRCFTVYQPLIRSSEILPVVLSSRCYGMDKLSGMNMLNEKSDENKAAKRYGFARVGLSSPDGYWTFGNDGIVNDEKPMPCSENDSKDITYIMTVMSFIDSRPNEFDASRVYTEGFSQNSMFSAYIGFCFGDKVVGIWQGGSGLALSSQKLNLPNCQVHCTSSAFVEYGRNCKTEAKCVDCKYWPIFPCYQPKRAMIDCVAEYTDDGISVSNDESTAINMYETLVNEGHDARLFRFAPNPIEPDQDKGIKGVHSDPENKVYWQVGCLGITPSCSSTCEVSFIDCVKSKSNEFAKDRFESCINESTFENLSDCSNACAPTLEMLKTSEEPTLTKLSKGVFGANAKNEEVFQPSTSMCTSQVGNL